MDTAQHLQVRVDVAFGLGEDHPPPPLIAEVLRCVHRDARRARAVQDQRVERAAVERGDRAALPSRPLLRFRPVDVPGRGLAVVDHGLAAGHLRHLEPRLAHLEAQPVDRRDRQPLVVAGADLLARGLVLLAETRRQLRDGDLVMHPLLLAGHFDGDAQRSLEIAREHIPEVELDAVADLDVSGLGEVGDEALHRAGEADHRLLARAMRLDRALRRRVGFDRQQHLVDDVVHDRREGGRVGAGIADAAISHLPGALGVEHVLDDLLARFLHRHVELEDGADRVGEVLVGLGVHRHALDGVLDAIERALAAHVLTRVRQHGRHDLLHRDAAALDELGELLRIIHRSSHVGPGVEVHDVRALGVGGRGEDHAPGAGGEVTHELGAVRRLVLRFPASRRGAAGVVALVEGEQSPLRHSTEEPAPVGRLALDRVHLVVGREDHVWQVARAGRLAAGERLHGLFLLGLAAARKEFAAPRRHGLAGLAGSVRLLLPVERFLVERNGLARVRDEHARLAAEHLGHADVAQVAVHVAEQVRLLGDEHRHHVVAHGVPQHGGNLPTLSNSSLVADYERSASFDVVDGCCDGVDLFGREILPDVGLVVAEAVRDEAIDGAVPLLDAIHGGACGVRHVDGDQRVERASLRRGRIGGLTALYARSNSAGSSRLISSPTLSIRSGLSGRRRWGTRLRSAGLSSITVAANSCGVVFASGWKSLRSASNSLRAASFISASGSSASFNSSTSRSASISSSFVRTVGIGDLGSYFVPG